MLKYNNGSYLVLPGMISLIIPDKKILSLVESLTILNLVDVKVSVRLFTYQPLNPRVYLKMCLQFQKHQKRNLQ